MKDSMKIFFFLLPTFAGGKDPTFSFTMKCDKLYCNSCQRYNNTIVIIGYHCNNRFFLPWKTIRFLLFFWTDHSVFLFFPFTMQFC